MCRASYQHPNPNLRIGGNSRGKTPPVKYNVLYENREGKTFRYLTKNVTNLSLVVAARAQLIEKHNQNGQFSNVRIVKYK